jgi:hypothetical protein
MDGGKHVCVPRKRCWWAMPGAVQRVAEIRVYYSTSAVDAWPFAWDQYPSGQRRSSRTSVVGAGLSVGAERRDIV